jgi:hypothetical protein
MYHGFQFQMLLSDELKDKCSANPLALTSSACGTWMKLAQQKQYSTPGAHNRWHLHTCNDAFGFVF